MRKFKVTTTFPPVGCRLETTIEVEEDTEDLDDLLQDIALEYVDWYYEELT